MKNTGDLQLEHDGIITVALCFPNIEDTDEDDHARLHAVFIALYMCMH